MRRVALTLLLLAAPRPEAGAQTPATMPVSATPDTVLPAAALQQDVAVLRQALESLHPGLYRYNTPASLRRRFALLEKRLAGGATIAQSYLAIAEFTSGLRDGHTFPNPSNQGARVAGAVFRSTPRVPFYFRWLDGHMVVTRDASAGGAFPRGTEVLSINGVNAGTILTRLLPYSRTDGSNEAKRVANMELRPADRWPAFDVLFPLLFRAPDSAWAFRIRRPGEAARTIMSAPTSLAHRAAVRDSAMPVRADSTSPPWSLEVGADGIATLVMPTWVTFNDRWDWQGFIHRAFAELAARRARALVIDLRGNEGGTGVGDVILSHLVDRDVTLDGLRRFTRYGRIPSTLRPYLDTWDRSFDDWGAAATPADAPPGAGTTGFFRLTRFDDGAAGTAIGPATPHYDGRVFVLVDAENSSATFEFALAVRQLRAGTLVGQPTGGNQRGINGGAFYFLRLPNSRIEVDLPLIGFFPASARPDAGIVPDVRVKVTPADIARGRDPEMAAVRALLARR